MIERTATIASTVGLHARPAAIFAEAAGDLGVEVTIARVGEVLDEAVDADSMLALMSLGIEFGEAVVLRTEDDSAPKVLRPWFASWRQTTTPNFAPSETPCRSPFRAFNTGFLHG